MYHFTRHFTLGIVGAVFNEVNIEVFAETVHNPAETTGCRLTALPKHSFAMSVYAIIVLFIS